MENFYILSTLSGLFIMFVGFVLLNEKLNQKLENDERIISRLDLLINEREVREGEQDENITN